MKCHLRSVFWAVSATGPRRAESLDPRAHAQEDDVWQGTRGQRYIRRCRTRLPLPYLSCSCACSSSGRTRNGGEHGVSTSHTRGARSIRATFTSPSTTRASTSNIMTRRRSITTKVFSTEPELEGVREQQQQQAHINGKMLRTVCLNTS
jgi:hypothetical protein